MHSFEPLLRSVLRQIRPRVKRILEWGPGLSTKVMLEETDAVVDSYEHDANYAAEAISVLSPEQGRRVSLRIIGYGQGICQNFGYATAPLRELIKATKQRSEAAECYDFAFIDGRARIDCLTVAWLLTQPNNGLVMLHDSDRSEYLPGIMLYEARMHSAWDRTAVLGHDAALIEQLRQCLRL